MDDDAANNSENSQNLVLKYSPTQPDYLPDSEDGGSAFDDDDSRVQETVSSECIGEEVEEGETTEKCDDATQPPEDYESGDLEINYAQLHSSDSNMNNNILSPQSFDVIISESSQLSDIRRSSANNSPALCPENPQKDDESVTESLDSGYMQEMMMSSTLDMSVFYNSKVNQPSTSKIANTDSSALTNVSKADVWNNFTKADVLNDFTKADVLNDFSKADNLIDQEKSKEETSFHEDITSFKDFDKSISSSDINRGPDPTLKQPVSLETAKLFNARPLSSTNTSQESTTSVQDLFVARKQRQEPDSVVTHHLTNVPSTSEHIYCIKDPNKVAIAMIKTPNRSKQHKLFTREVNQSLEGVDSRNDRQCPVKRVTTTLVKEILTEYIMGDKVLSSKSLKEIVGTPKVTIEPMSPSSYSSTSDTRSSGNDGDISSSVKTSLEKHSSNSTPDISNLSSIEEHDLQPSLSKKRTRIRSKDSSSSSDKPDERNKVPRMTTKTMSKSLHIEETAVRSPLSIGTLVMAQWKDTYFYSGRVEQNLISRCLIVFDDGDRLSVPSTSIIPVDKLPIGQSVLVEGSDGHYDPGIIARYIGRSENFCYEVELDNRRKLRFRRSQVILSVDQASCLTGGSNIFITQKDTSLNRSTVSLDNLIDSKRRPKPKDLASSETNENDGGNTSRSRKGKGPAKKSEVFQSVSCPKMAEDDINSSARKRKYQKFTPHKTSTPTRNIRDPKLPKLKNLDENDKNISDNSKTDDKYVVPRLNRKLFKGYSFLLTQAPKMSDTTEEVKNLSCDSSSATSTASDDTNIPFAKDHLKKLIRSGGGKILDTCDIKKKRSRHVYLISDTHLRTEKYLFCLAAKIPCIRHYWILDSCQQGRLLDYSAYLLPAGISLEQKLCIEQDFSLKPFPNVRLHIWFNHPRLVAMWSSILECAGALITASEDLNTESYPESKIRAVISDKSCPEKLETSALAADIPVLSTEWCTQTLICGHLAPFTGHPQYRHNFQQDNI